MKFYYYIFYRIMNYYSYPNKMDSKRHAFIITGAILLIHMLSILLIVSSIVDFNMFNIIRIDNGMIDRFIVIPLVALPFYIFIYAYSKKNKELINNSFSQFDNEEQIVRKRKGLFVILYFVATFLFLIASITSSSWL